MPRSCRHHQHFIEDEPSIYPPYKYALFHAGNGRSFYRGTSTLGITTLLTRLAKQGILYQGRYEIVSLRDKVIYKREFSIEPLPTRPPLEVHWT